MEKTKKEKRRIIIKNIDKFAKLLTFISLFYVSFIMYKIKSYEISFAILVVACFFIIFNQLEVLSRGV